METIKKASRQVLSGDKSLREAHEYTVKNIWRFKQMDKWLQKSLDFPEKPYFKGFEKHFKLINWDKVLKHTMPKDFRYLHEAYQ
jgi:hypothetical protein